MANRTVKDAVTVKGTNPQYLIEKIIRTRIYDSRYWKEECFALSAELLVDKAMELKYIGGVYSGNVKPTPFLCLVLKMLQIQPDKDIIVEFISNEDYKYVRCLGAYYMRLTGTSLDCYKYLEPLLNDYRKVKFQDRNGNFNLKHVDEFIDDLIREERVCDVILPRVQKRHVLEENEMIDPRVSALDDDLDDLDESSSSEEDDEDQRREERRRRRREEERRLARRSPSPYNRRRSRSRSPRRRDIRSRRSRSPMIRRRRSRERSPLISRRREERRDERSDRRNERDERDERKKKRRRDRDSSEEKDKKKKKKKKKDKKDKRREEEEDIRQQNELRRKLGLDPLKI